MDGRLVGLAKDRAKYYVEMGYSVSAAANRATSEILEGQGFVNGLGDDNILADAANVAPVKAARELVSPWLWVFSVIGFGMAVLNTRRIAKMYHKWRESKSGALSRR